MVKSEIRPSEIQIINVMDDVRKGKVKVKYVFNYNITEVQEEVTEFDEDGNEIQVTKIMYEYEQFIFESEFDLLFKNIIPQILKTMYEEKKTEILNNIALANTELPKEISIGGGE
ncbi:hypothetical protein [Marinitoga sp. 1155]|uniref:hypothetical protein n=1 Tax=Marinitoga sp. 1155 TaxID=1428448 RepID=UPI000640C188|nr:hypothetical protein [Marinitoga sp. 1155]AJW77003.1 hypothetical protein UF09_37 [Marinitoga camini virus 2]KLO24823.1 hypothetical protein X274_02450 [Marinitoga sp. 1155]